MQPVQREEVLGIVEYEKVRPHFRARVIEEKKARRVALSNIMSAVFENHDTVLLQIQEMLRTERITKEDSILHEIETYNELVPGPGQLKLTLFVEIADAEERERMLRRLAGLEDHVELEIRGQRIVAQAKDRSVEGYERTTAVHYFTFELPEAAVAALREGASATLLVSHPEHTAHALLGPETLRALREDLA
jgi:hypothetical protein